jgi:hypothetical protein
MESGRGKTPTVQEREILWEEKDKLHLEKRRGAGKENKRTCLRLGF